MDHPLLSIRNQFFGAWMMLMLAHVLVLRLVFNLPWFASALDSVFFNGGLMMFGLAYWNLVRYGTPKGKNYAGAVLVHLLAVSLIIGIVLQSSKALTLLLVSEPAPYLDFLDLASGWRMALGLFYLALMIMFYYLSIYYSEQEALKSREIMMQSLVKEAELTALKAQINPHFIFNSLNSVNALIHMAPDKASDMLVKLSQFLRFSLSKDNHDLSTLDDELINIQRYLDIEKVRFEEKLFISMHVDPKARPLNIPSLLLQPLLENSIKYGVYESLEESSILLHAGRKNGHLVVRISNDYDPNAAPKKGSGIGLKNVQERLEILYGSRELLKVVPEKNKFIVEVTIPQHKEHA